MPSYMKSMTSQLVLMVAIAITLMQLYRFFITGEILDIFNSLASMVLGAYFRGMLNETPDNKLNEPKSKIVDEGKPIVESNTETEQQELDFISQKLS